MEPTEKQENAVIFICKRLHISPPEEHSKESYWKFIKENLEKAQEAEEPDDETEDFDDEAEHLFHEAGGYW